MIVVVIGVQHSWNQADVNELIISFRIFLLSKFGRKRPFMFVLCRHYRVCAFFRRVIFCITGKGDTCVNYGSVTDSFSLKVYVAAGEASQP